MSLDMPPAPSVVQYAHYLAGIALQLPRETTKSVAYFFGAAAQVMRKRTCVCVCIGIVVVVVVGAAAADDNM